MAADLTLTDQSQNSTFFIDGAELSVEDFLLDVDKKIEHARQSGDIELIGMELRSRNAFTKATVMSTAKLVYETGLLWNELKLGSSMEFYDWARTNAGLAEGTTRNYINAWSAYLLSPPEYKPKLLEQPIRNLQELGSKLGQGLVLEDETWEKLVDTKGNAEFRHLLAENNEDDKPRSNRITIYLERSGDIQVWCNGKNYYGGYLNMEDDADGVLQKFRNRTAENSGYIRR